MAADGQDPGPPWWPSVYGAGDQIGAGNELTQEATLAALRLPRSGRVVELAQLTTADVPVIQPRIHHQLIMAHENLEEVSSQAGDNRFSTFSEQVVTSYHVGCHLDGLGHAGIDGRYYNGLHYSQIFAATGLTQLGIENVRPWAGRGIVLDVAGLYGRECLEDGTPITSGDLECAARQQRVEVRAGDAVLVHTGWSELWDREPERYAATEPGLDAEAAGWLARRRVSLVAVDNWGCDVYPNPVPGQFFPAHQRLLTRGGIYILENIRTSELVRGTAGTPFLFILGVPRLQGATAAVVAPLAVLLADRPAAYAGRDRSARRRWASGSRTSQLARAKESASASRSSSPRPRNSSAYS
jgi:kynurenine formamidase